MKTCWEEIVLSVSLSTKGSNISTKIVASHLLRQLPLAFQEMKALKALMLSWRKMKSLTRRKEKESSKNRNQNRRTNKN